MTFYQLKKLTYAIRYALENSFLLIHPAARSNISIRDEVKHEHKELNCSIELRVTTELDVTACEFITKRDRFYITPLSFDPLFIRKY